MPFSSRHTTLAPLRPQSQRSFSLSLLHRYALIVLALCSILLSAAALSAAPSGAVFSLELLAEIEFLEFDLALGFWSVLGKNPALERTILVESPYASSLAYLCKNHAAMLKYEILLDDVAFSLTPTPLPKGEGQNPRLSLLPLEPSPLGRGQGEGQDTTSRPIPRRVQRTSRTLNQQQPKNTTPPDDTPQTSINAPLSTNASLSTNAVLSTSAALTTENIIRALAAQRLSLLSTPSVDVNAWADSLGVRRGAVDGAVSRKGTEAIPFGGQTYNFQAKFDSTQLSNALRMKLGDRLLGSEYRPEQTLPLDEYLNNRTDFMRRQAQDSILQHYDFRRPFKLELSSILGQANNFNVPFPQNPLTTIFGKPELRLNANIEINLRIGSMWNTSLGGQASTLGQVQWVPVFQPNVQANVDAKLGDKFNINLDMNTLRQFEFDNLTRLAYDGEPDEIFRRIEFGNVSLNSPSAFIGGSQALFGVRADFQFGPVYLKTVASMKRGQSRVATVKGGSVKQPIMLRAYDYADNHFFINLAHKTVVWPVFERGGFPLQATVNTQLYRVKAVEVWESTPDLRDVQAADVLAIDTLRPLSEARRDTLINGTPSYTLAEKRRLFDSTGINAGFVEKGRFRLLRENERYTFDANLGTLRILNLRRDRSYAIAYRLEGATQANEDDIVYGTLQNTIDPAIDTAKISVLQLIYRPNMQPAFRNIWARQRQNVYFIGATNVSRDPKDTRINFWYLRQNNDSTDILPGAQDKLATVLGVDRVNNTSGAATPDGLFDIHLGYIFDQARGEITFTSLEPFRRGLIDYFTSKGNADQANQFIFASVYDTTRDAARLDARFDRFVISGEVSGQASNRINLPNAFNLAPGSVKVRLNGAVLTEFQDFRVEYFTGQVEILNPQALLPNANVEVEYEQNDAFNLATRSMLGLRLDLDTKSFLRSRDLKLDLGLTVVNYSMDNPAARIRLSEEPLSNTMLGVDGQATLNADWLTKALDWLPFYDTKAPSSFNIKGEAAWSLSNPNTRPSEIASDSNKAAVYIDDFEATQRIYALGVQAAQWKYASPPQNTGIPNLQTLTRLDSAQRYRGAMRWYTFNEGRVPPTQVYPNRAVAVGIAGTPPLRPLEIDFNPYERGIYNTNPSFVDSLTYLFNPAPPPTGLGDTTEYKRLAADPILRNTLFGFREKNRIWGGIMRTLSAFNLNFDNENMDFIEIVLRVDGRSDPQTKMYIDVGQISEDIIPNGILDTEDGIVPGRETPNGRIAEGELGEDVGIDGLNNAQEKSDSLVSALSSVSPLVQAKYRNLTAQLYSNPNIRRERDPARDDFNYDFRRFSTVAANAQQRDSDFVSFNGLENNNQFTDFQFPDTEIQNQNNGQIIARADDYFRYEVNLTPDRATNPQFVNSVNGWITLRIPLRGARTEVGRPLFTNIQYVRALWVGGRFKAQIIDWRFVGSQWIRQPVQVGRTERGVPLLDSTTLSVGFVGREENSGAPFFYTMPPGVFPPVNRNNFLNPTQFGNEQSLLMQVNGLRQGDERSVARFFRPFDAFFYKEMKFFLHGGENITYTPTRRSEAQALGFIRFGVDTLNYYEYSVPLQPGWQAVAIKLPELTALKPIVQLSGANAGLTVIPADSLGEYRIKGSPTLTRIQFVSFGVRNPAVAPSELTTSVWVNELRLIKPDISENLMQNFAAVGTASAKIADLGTVTATLNMQTPYFTRLEERFGNRNDRRTLAVTGQFNFERFLPEDWAGSSLPLSVTYNNLESTPRFLPQNDVNLSVAAFNEAEKRFPTDSASRVNAAQETIKAQSTRTEDLQVAVTGARLNIPIYFFLFRDILNRISVDYNYVRRKEESPVVTLKTFEGWRFRTAYNHTLPPLPIKPFGWAENVPVLQWLSGWTIFAPVPNTITAAVEANQSFQREISRIQPDVSIPNILNFEAARQLQLTYKMSENELLNPTIDYSVNTVGTLVPLWLEDGSRDKPLPAGEVQRRIWERLGQGNSILNIGTDTRHGQNFRITFRPKFPEFMGGNKFFNLTGNYGVQYGWERLLRPVTLTTPTTGGALPVTPADANALNNGAGFQNNLTAAFSIRPKELGNALFPSLSSPMGGGQNTFQPGLQATIVPTPSGGSDTSIAMMIMRGLKSAVFDWDQFTVSFTQQGSATNPGVRGGTGFLTSSNGYGPSFEYQMGLVTDPHTSWFQPSNQFPFFEMRRVQGSRPVGVDLPDMSKIGATLDIRAQREIIPGLQVELSWQSKNDSTNNRIFTQIREANVQILNDTYRISNQISLETFGRSFLMVPFGGLDNIKKLYDTATAKITDNTPEATAKRQKALNSAFIDGLEALHWLNGDTTRFRFLMPNINFAIRWNGLEQLPFLKGILRSGSLESKYQGRYTATQRNEAGVTTLDQQSVQSSFEPLIGVTAQFDDKAVDGILQGNMRVSTKTSLGIMQSQQGIVQSDNTFELTLQATYQRRGFELPKIGGVGLLKLLGIDFEMNNDIEFGLQTTYRSSLRTSTNVIATPTPRDATANQSRRIDGTTNILFEPSMRYTISKQVTARLFFRYEANLSEGANAAGSTVTQFGVDLRLNLSGGRSF
ncbi:MAG: cell surface protein SprA [Candidatus Kapabacteria bacterium]|jgi:cell surface protein SprA|nr:cell surface protein SprA [Candidatus Kapabacteria bacterium]